LADAAKRLDEGGCARRPCLYSLEAHRVRKGEIGGGFGVGDFRKGGSGDGVGRRKVLLTRGPASSATGRRGEGARDTGPAAAAGLGPRRRRRPRE
jgi:hypothetical protein